MIIMTTDNSNELHVILGAGSVGIALIDALVACGKRVRIVNRGGVKALPNGVENLRGDVASLDFARKTAEGATHVYDALGAPYDRWAELFHRYRKVPLRPLRQPEPSSSCLKMCICMVTRMANR